MVLCYSVYVVSNIYCSSSYREHLVTSNNRAIDLITLDFSYKQTELIFFNHGKRHEPTGFISVPWREGVCDWLGPDKAGGRLFGPLAALVGDPWSLRWVSVYQLLSSCCKINQSKLLNWVTCVLHNVTLCFLRRPICSAAFRP